MNYIGFRKNKKADILPEETLKIILAVIGIGLLILLAVLLYGIFSKRQDVVQAETNMNYITTIINRMNGELSGLNQEGVKTEAYVLLNPSGWGVFAWPIGAEEEKPNACLNWEKCICFCEINWFSKVPLVDKMASYLKSCNQLSVCREIKQDEFSVEPTNPIQINELIKKDKAKELEITLEMQEDKKTKLTIEAISKK